WNHWRIERRGAALTRSIMGIRRVIVTGGAGFIGSALCRHLVLRGGCTVLNIDKLTYAANPASLSDLEGGPAYRLAVTDITDEVYGDLGPTGLFTEDTPYAPNSPYSASKAASDHFAHAWHTTYGLPVVISNCSNNYGPRQFPEKLIPHMIIRAIGGQSLPVY